MSQKDSAPVAVQPNAFLHFFLWTDLPLAALLQGVQATLLRSTDLLNHCAVVVLLVVVIAACVVACCCCGLLLCCGGL